MSGAAFVTRASLLAAAAALLTSATACRQIAGIQPLPKPCGDPLAIDDMEDGDPSICNSQGRQGTWYSFGDGTSIQQTLAPNATIPGGRSASRRAVHFSGGGFSSWGAIAGANFDDDGLHRTAYDAGNAGGLTFWMQSNAPVTVQLLLPETVLKDDDGDCVDGASPNNCNDHFAFQIASPESGWKQYHVPFSALRQSPKGTATWDPSQLLAVQFLVGPGSTFDLWIDDVAFYYCAGTECVPTCTQPGFSVPCPKTARHAAECLPDGTACADANAWCADQTLIDDMEDGDEVICATSGRQGYWYAFAGGSIPAHLAIAEIPGGRGDSRRAAHLTGSGLTGWGAGMGMNLSGGGASTYDASAFRGIHFWMKATSEVRVQFALPSTTPASTAPGTCTNPVDCNNDFGLYITPNAGAWTEFNIPFAALTHDHLGADADGNAIRSSTVWDPSQLLTVEFSVPLSDFELWVDDVSFYDCQGDACVPTCNTPDAPVPCPATSDRVASCWPGGTDCSAPPPSFFYNSVWGSSASDVWVAGIGPAVTGVIRHFDGQTWSAPMSTPHPLWSLRGSGAGDLWAVGDFGTILHGDGASWSPVSTPTTASLASVWATAADEAWTVGYGGTILIWNRAKWWTATTSASGINLWGVASAGRNEAWAVGDGGTIGHLQPGWTSTKSGTSVTMNGVWAGRSDDVWAIGNGATTLHWNGNAWSPFDTATTNPLYGIWGSASDDVWAVGYNGATVHWTGSIWTSSRSGTTATLVGVWASGPADVWAVGGTILHFDGAAWSEVSPDAPSAP